MHVPPGPVAARRRPRSLPAALLLIAAASARAQDANVIPAQFIAKMYTEALGRAPDQPGWSRSVAFFAAQGCDAATLRQLGAEFYTSPEFARDYADNAARVLALYRGALNRDADQAGLDGDVALLDAGVPWPQVVAALFDSAEFAGNVPSMCSATAPDYHFGDQVPPIPVPGRDGFAGTAAELQSILGRAAAGATVSLAQKAVITIDATLTVPSGVTLATVGAPAATSYALMARLVRGTSFDGPVVAVSPGAQLAHVWVDGQRQVLGYHKVAGGTGDNANIVTLGGAGVAILGNKMSDPQGGSNFFSAGAPCSDETVRGNLVTAYSAVHDISGFSDGLTMACEGLDLEDNDIVDVTDVAIVLFATPGVTQHSLIAHNRIVSAGLSTNAAISADPSTGNPGGSSLDYAGTLFADNLFWTGPYTSFDFGIEAGGRPFFSLAADNSNGSGATYTNNTTGSLSARVRAGIAVAGMLDVTVANDGAHPLDLIPVALAPGAPAALCPGGAVIAETSAGDASGTFPPPTVDGNFDGCVNPRFVAIPSSAASVTVSALTFDAASGTFDGTITIENIGEASLTGPFGIVFTALSGGAALVNATATVGATPFLAFPEVLSLAPGETATVATRFTNSSTAPIAFKPLLFSGVPAQI